MGLAFVVADAGEPAELGAAGKVNAVVAVTL